MPCTSSDGSSNDPGGGGDRSPSAVGLTRAVDLAARDYFAQRRDRVDRFVDRHFTLAGSARIHRRALGWDLLKAPANLLLAVPHVVTRLGAAGLRGVGARGAGRWLDSRQILFETAVGSEIQWLIMTELLELPFAQAGRESRKDALLEAILASPELQTAFTDALLAIGRRSDDAAFRQEVEQALLTYAGSRAAAAEITTALMTLGAGAVALKQATPGMVTLGPAVAAVLAQQAAIASFPLGTSLGGFWYGLFPVSVSPWLTVGVTGGLVATGAVAAAFAGILADPLQRQLGLHHRRLRALIDALEQHVRWGTEGRFVVRDHYVARLLDVFDLLGSLARLART